jgi:hypothetical protein
MQTEKMEQQQKTAEQVSTASAPRQSQRTELAAARTPTKPRVKGLTREERVQLAADLRLIPGTEEEESLFELPEQPNQ